MLASQIKQTMYTGGAGNPNKTPGALAGKVAAGVQKMPTVQTKKKKTTGGGSGAAQGIDPAYGQNAAYWQNQWSGAQKPTYTDSYAARIAQMEKDGTPQYTSKYQAQIDGLLDQIAGRGAFHYNLSEDPLYQQYKNQYMENGRAAMRDTMGQAAALTGGYGSSYASTAGNQAYQQYLGQLNDKALDLQQNALNVYQAEGSRLQQLLGNYQTEEGSNYDRHRDDVNDYYNALDALRQGQQTEYGRYRDDMSDWNTEQERALAQWQYWDALAKGRK